MNNTVTENTRLHLNAAVAKLSELMTKDAPEFHAESMEEVGRRLMELGAALKAVR